MTKQIFYKTHKRLQGANWCCLDVLLVFSKQKPQLVFLALRNTSWGVCLENTSKTSKNTSLRPVAFCAFCRILVLWFKCMFMSGKSSQRFPKHAESSRYWFLAISQNWGGGKITPQKKSPKKKISVCNKKLSKLISLSFQSKKMRLHFWTICSTFGR